LRRFFLFLEERAVNNTKVKLCIPDDLEGGEENLDKKFHTADNGF